MKVCFDDLDLIEVVYKVEKSFIEVFLVKFKTFILEFIMKEFV